MYKHNRISIALAAAGFGFAATTQAATAVNHSADSRSFFSPVPKVIREADSGIRIGIGSLHQHYVETSPQGMTYDQEHGSMPVYTLESGHQWDHFGFGADLQYANGNSHYNGYQQFLNTTTGQISLTPYQTRTHNKMLDAMLHIDYGFSPLPHFAVIPEAFVGEHVWNREIKGAGAVTENYIECAGKIGEE